MSAKSILGSESKEAKAKHGSGTRVAGYAGPDWAPFRCSHCEYFEKPNLCGNKVVAKDPQVPRDKKSGKKLVSPQGCCSYFEPADQV